MTRKIKEQYEKWGLSMNIKKTKYLCIGRQEGNLQIGNNRGNQFARDTNLGVEIRSDGRDVKVKLGIRKEAVKTKWNMVARRDIKRKEEENI